MNFINSITKKIIADNELTGFGLSSTDLDMCRNFDWYPIEVGDIPRYCIYSEKPYLKKPEQSGNVFVQKYGVMSLTNDEQVDQVVGLKKLICQKIDVVTAAAIVKGFEYRIETADGKRTYHFSYDYADQRNFTDTATVIVLILVLTSKGACISNMPETVNWNAYKNYDHNSPTRTVVNLDLDNFLNLYIAALKHKLSCLETGKRQKMYVTNVCNTIERLKEFVTTNDIDIQLYNI